MSRRSLFGMFAALWATRGIAADPAPVAFPFPLVSVPGDQALATWRHLRAEKTGWPVVLGSDEDLHRITAELLELEPRTPQQILAAATALTFPDGLRRKRAIDLERARQWLRDNGKDDLVGESAGPPVGDWPEEAATAGFTVATDVLSGKFHDIVHIARLPVDTGWEAIAHLRWGNWNENPPAEHHVAALRSWHERFGAELVGLTGDTMNLHVATRPATRAAALALAREHYLYCNDTVDQGTETLSALAAALMNDDWWFFWWD